MKASGTLPQRKKEGNHGTCQGGIGRVLGDDTIIAHQRIAWATSTWDGVQDFLWGRPTHLALYPRDRKSTRLNSSHANISYAVFCLKKKTHTPPRTFLRSPAMLL